jgi:hypothetical protein
VLRVPVGGRPWRRRLERRRGKLGVALGCWGHGEYDAREGAARGGRWQAGDVRVSSVRVRQSSDHCDGDEASASQWACLRRRGEVGEALGRGRHAGGGRGCSSAWRSGASRIGSGRGHRVLGTFWARLGTACLATGVQGGGLAVHRQCPGVPEMLNDKV